MVNLKLAQREKQGKRSVVWKEGEEIPREKLVKERRHTLSTQDIMKILHSGLLINKVARWTCADSLQESCRKRRRALLFARHNTTL